MVMIKLTAELYYLRLVVIRYCFESGRPVSNFRCKIYLKLLHLYQPLDLKVRLKYLEKFTEYFVCRIFAASDSTRTCKIQCIGDRSTPIIIIATSRIFCFDDRPKTIATYTEQLISPNHKYPYMMKCKTM